MIPPVQYFVLSDDDDVPTGLGKIVSNESGLFGYSLHNGEWKESRLILQCPYDQSVGELVDEAEAARLAARFGGKL